jgi:RNA polymerase sigma factor (sigma-70 family)
MINSINENRRCRELAAAETFLKSPNDESFTELFLTFTPQLVSFFRSCGCRPDLSEDLSHEVMLTVYRKATQLRDRTRFRAWLFTIGRRALYRHYGKQFAEAVNVDLDSVADSNTKAGPRAFEFHHWLSCLEAREQEALTLRFVEEWKYHEIAAEKAIPIGTVQWRVFNAQKKLAIYLKHPCSSGKRQCEKLSCYRPKLQYSNGAESSSRGSGLKTSYKEKQA